MPEDPLVLGNSSIMNIPESALLDMCPPESIDVLVVDITDRSLSDAMTYARRSVRDGGTLIALNLRERGADAYVHIVGADNIGNIPPRILRKAQGALRTTDGKGAVRMKCLRTLFANIPANTRVVGLTSCAGQLPLLAQEFSLRLVCTEQDLRDFWCAVANIGRATNFQPHSTAATAAAQ